MLAGVIIFFLNFLTYSLWQIDVDILGAGIFILGLVITIACGPSMKSSSKLFSRENGVWLCVISMAITALFGYLPFPALNGDIAGITGMCVFLLGLILIIFRWKY